MRSLLFIALGSAFLLLTGCASGAKMQNMVATPNLSYNLGLKKQISAQQVTGGSETSPLWTSEISCQSFKAAIESSLKSEGLFSDKGRYTLKANIIDVGQPFMGFNMTVTTHVRYILTDVRTNKIVLDEIIVTPFTATVSDAFVAVTRLRLANEGAGKANIKGLLKKLASLQVETQDVSVTK